MEGEEVVSGMQALITNLEPMITEVFTVVSKVGETIVSTPILLMTTGFLVVGGAIGIFGRMISKS